MRNYKLILILVTLPFCLQGVDAGSECPPWGSVRMSLSNSTAVFSGEVVSEEYRDTKTDAWGEPAEAKALVVKLKVNRWWKGSGAEEVYLLTSVRKFPDGRTSLLADDFFFRKGESYLVYAYGPEENLQTDGCTRTRGLAEAGEDLSELGEGTVPEKLRK